MKIIINKTGEIQDVTDRVATRLINKGKAHPAPIATITRIKPKKGKAKWK